MNFKDRLRELRTGKGLTQEELGKVFNVIKQTVSSWENGGSKPDIGMASELAEFFGVSTDYLLGRTNSPQISDIITRAEQMDLNEDQKSALEEYKKMPLNEQQKRLVIVVNKIKSLPAADQEALLRIIDSLSCH